LPDGPVAPVKVNRAGVLNGSTPPVQKAPELEKETPAAPSRPRTAPGTMLGFMSAQSEAIKEAEALRAQLKAFDGAAPVRALDPKAIVRSKWANRHETAFDTPEFEALKLEIEQAGGNVQPVKVRPKSGQPGVYELVFGHRRHQACLQLDLPVNALIEETSEQELFEQMERENRGRANLSAWEQGCMYRQAIDEGLYSSMRKLSESVGVDLSLVSKSIALARLPSEVVAAFQSPLDIQFRWAQPLSEAQQKDPEALLQRARQIIELRPRPASSKVFAVLTGAEVLNGSTPEKRADQTIQRDGKRVAALSVDAKGRALVRFEAGVLLESKHRELLKLIENFLK
ncbi:MAG: ParB/RepB/Spo0J family partition protein, partial [Burkholderiales bacterium]|nr:ParB/RepB/Spo0J family partition protein [Burkholderiales bacterium]